MPSAAHEAHIQRAIRRCTGASSVDTPDALQSLWGGYGTILRYELSGARCRSVIVKHVAPPGGTKRRRSQAKDVSHARKLSSYDVELAFYQTHAPRLPPTARTAALLAGQRLDDAWIFVLEDLDAAGFSGRSKQLTDAELLSCLDWLASFHATFLGVAPDGLWKVGTYWHLATRQQELLAMRDRRLRALAPACDRALSEACHKTLVHGDAKVQNFCFGSKGDGARVAAVDFQYVGAGCGMKDVVYFLDSCLDAFELELRADALLDEYFTRLRGRLAAAPPRADLAEVDIEALEAEWRRLYPVAWADLYRFLDGWAPGHFSPGGHVRSMIERAASLLGSQ